MGETTPPENLSRILSIGHSTHELTTFLELLTRQEVARLIDVRLTPKSRRMPHFNMDALASELPPVGVDYIHLPELGGRRKAALDSVNTAWEVDGFRGYADYMRSGAFASALSRLEVLASEKTTAYMCAEGLWWRCHRRLISDSLLVRGWDVHHILPDGRLESHSLTEFAVVEGSDITYPTEQGQLEL